jgi:isoquinoline 1-oxidoreductase beta subunit
LIGGFATINKINTEGSRPRRRLSLLVQHTYRHGEISANSATIKVDHVVAAVDCGVAINSDIVTAQIEGAIGFALSTAPRNQVTLNKGMVEQSNFDDYEPTRMREMPKVEVHIVRSTEPPSGIGEPGVPPLAPAIGNAIFAATGKRLRSLPFNLGATG